MFEPRYIEQTIGKLDAVVNTYMDMIYEKVGEAAAKYAETEEQLYENYGSLDFLPCEKGTVWGKQGSNAWFTAEISVPEKAVGKSLFVRILHGGIEALIFVNGKPAGLHNRWENVSASDVLINHDVVYLSGYAKSGDTFSVAAEAYAGHFIAGCMPYENYEIDDNKDVSEERFHRCFNGIELYVLNKTASDFVIRLRNVLQLYRVLPESNFVKAEALKILLEVSRVAVLMPKHSKNEDVAESMEKCIEIMEPMFNRTDEPKGYCGIMGHSHMDTAWLWPVKETIRKCARTYAGVLSFMERYPDYTFIQSSMLHTEWMRKYYPTIFEMIKQCIEEGRYELNGGSMVEFDCNLTGGEPMIRSILRGQLFNKKYFNRLSDSFWMPDTFGYSAALPQILSGFNINTFYTTKIYSNDLNQFPYDTFVWQGIDGTKILAHFHTLHCWPDPATVSVQMNAIKHKELTQCKILPFGFGDGGGGPSYGMLESAELVGKMPTMPEIEYTNMSGFSKKLRETTDLDSLPVHKGELYYEAHRGTLTSIHDIKRLNRKCESRLRNLEILNMMAKEKTGVPSIDMWPFYDALLINQFHDILPGSSIQAVNETAISELSALYQALLEETDKQTAQIADGDNGYVTLFNTLSHERSGQVLLELESGIEAPCQEVKDVLGKKLIAAKITIPPLSGKAFAKKAVAKGNSCFSYDGVRLETPVYSVIFDESGYICSLYDKTAERQLAKQPIGMFVIGEDVPAIYDNWEIDIAAMENLKPCREFEGREVISDGELQFRLKSHWKIGDASAITQVVIFYSDSRMISYDTQVDWNEKHRLLKTVMDCGISSQFSRHEVQFGHLLRSTDNNNSWTAAQFEVCNHKWSDISETRYGVAVINDCKYGISVEDTALSLTLQKGGCRPDPRGDYGIKRMEYALLPHEGAFSAENVIYPAYELNNEVYIANGRGDTNSFARLNSSNIIIEAVKKAEDGEGTVLRLYEAEGSFTNAKLKVNSKEAYATDMMENITENLPFEGGELKLAFHPFEIKTVILN